MDRLKSGRSLEVEYKGKISHKRFIIRAAEMPPFKCFYYNEKRDGHRPICAVKMSFFNL